VQELTVWTPPTGVLGALVEAAEARAAAAEPDRARLSERLAAREGRPPSFVEALRATDRLRVIAEIKRRSPSQGDLAPTLDAGEQARAFARGGAAAISVLTEPERFGGALSDLPAAAVAGVPLLRKDFIVAPIQVLEAAAYGASAVLLIARALPPSRLADLHAEATALGLGTLVEVHDAAELEVALAAAYDVIGVNNRNLETLHIDPAIGEALVPRIPADRVAVYESGIRTLADAERAVRAGADAVLVGTTLSRTGDAAEMVRDLSNLSRGRRGA
jgi:indole-3-glycerol phosphate synthase